MPEVRGYGAEHASNPHFTPGSWRNGGGPDAAGGGGNHVPNVMYSSAAPGSGKSSTATLQMPGEVPILRRLSDFGGSVDSMDTSEDASDRRGSATGSSVGKDGKERHGVGSRLSDLVEKGKGGKKPKRKKDKQGMMSDGQRSSSKATHVPLPMRSGFVWRRMIHDQEDFSQTRTPRLAPTPAPASTTVPQSTVSAQLKHAQNETKTISPPRTLSVGTHAVPAAWPSVFAGGDVERCGDVAA